jgi:hypothetical protein
MNYYQSSKHHCSDISIPCKFIAGAANTISDSVLWLQNALQSEAAIPIAVSNTMRLTSSCEFVIIHGSQHRSRYFHRMSSTHKNKTKCGNNRSSVNLPRVTIFMSNEFDNILCVIN